LISSTTAGTHMKMVVAYVDPERFGAIREDLLEQGFGTLDRPRR